MDTCWPYYRRTQIGYNEVNLRLYCHVDAGNTQNYSTLMETDAIHWSGGQPITAPGETGGAVSCSRAPRPWQGGGLPPLQLSVYKCLSANLPVIGLHSHH